MDELTLRDYLKVLFRQKWVIITAFITVSVTAALGLWMKTETYVATVKMLVTSQKEIESPYYGPLVGMQNIQVALTQSEIVKSNPVMERALKAVGLKPLDFEKKFASPPRRLLIDRQIASINGFFTERKLDDQQKQSVLFRYALEDLKRNVKVEPVRDTNLFTISYKDFDPGIAAVIANIVSRSYIIFDLEQQLAELQMKYGDKNLAVTQLKDNITKMEESLNGQPLPNIEAIGPASVKIIEQAMPSMSPSGQPKSLMLILAVFMSVFLGVMLAFGFEYMDQSFKSPQDAEKILEMPLLGSIPKKSKPQSYEFIADQLCFELRDRNLRSLMIAAALPKEGVTTAIANLAKTIANKCRPKVLIIDANLRKPAMHQYFKIPNNDGLVGVLEGRLSLEKAVHNTGDNLFILTAGKADISPATLIESKSMAELINTAKEKYDVVFLDCPSLREAKDAIALSSHVDSIVFMVNEGRTRRQTAQAAVMSLRGSEATKQSRAVFLGVIVGNRTFTIPKAIYDRA
jgi:capsular exopolysaccharide synthesis family protein